MSTRISWSKCYVNNDAANLLISSLTSFVNFVFAGNVPPCAQPFFFGATLVGLNKKDGGVRSIAIGCTLRSLVAKCACSQICSDMSAILSPLQLGYGTPRGAEAVVHAARTYLSSMDNSCYC